MEHIYKIGQKVLFIGEVEGGKSPLINEEVEISGIYDYPNEGITYYLKGYEKDFDGTEQVFLKEQFMPLLKIV